jgi:hypothetical protein
LTPIQRQKIIAISVLVTAILATTVVTIVAILMQNNLVLLGLIPGIGGVIGGIAMTVHYFGQLDLDSPKKRRAETEMLRTHKFTLSQINARYGNFDTVVVYQLMGEAPESTYLKAAHLCQKQAEADRIYTGNASNIQSAFDRAIAPARAALASAQQAESLATTTLVTAQPGYRTIPTVATINASYNSGYAAAQMQDTLRQVRPLYDRALQKLREAYDAVAQPLADEFMALSLGFGAQPR